MPRPPSSLIRTKLPCAPTVDNVQAIQACEAAAGKSGFLVASRTAGSLVLMPSPKHTLIKCMAPGCTFPSDRALNAGHGIAAELVPDPEGEGLAVSVATNHTTGGEKFVLALTAQLDSLVNSQSTRLVVWEGSTQSSSSRTRREAQAYYYYSKLLFDKRQAPGQAASEFTESFVETCNTLNFTALEQGRLLAELSAGVNRLCAVVDAHEARDQTDRFCAANSELAVEFRPWMRSSVERCVYTRVGGPLWSLYEGRHSAEDAQFTDKVQMLRQVDATRLLQALEVRLEFRGAAGAAAPAGHKQQLLLDDFDPGTSSSELTPSTGVGTGTSTDDSPSRMAQNFRKMGSSFSSVGTQPRTYGSSGPYERAAAALSQLEVALCSGRGCPPQQVIEALTLSQLEMKTCAFEASAGQIELHAMDDIMPVFIFVLLRSTMLCPFACAGFMQDALSPDERLDSEGRAVLLLESAARYIAYDWDITELVPSPV